MANQTISDTKPQSSKKALTLLSVIVLALLIGIFSWWYFDYFRKSDIRSLETSILQKPIFFKLEPFTVNLNGDKRGKMLYIVLTLRLENSSDSDLLKNYLPEIRNRIILTLTQQSSAQLAEPDGKSNLASLLMQQINQPVNAHDHLTVQNVLFSDFIVQ